MEITVNQTSGSTFTLNVGGLSLSTYLNQEYMVHMDPSLMQIFTNGTTNHIKFSEDTREIVITSDKKRHPLSIVLPEYTGSYESSQKRLTNFVDWLNDKIIPIDMNII